MMRPNDLPNTMDYHLFKTGIKPMWEVRCVCILCRFVCLHLFNQSTSLMPKCYCALFTQDSANRRGGKWMVRLRKGIASRYWEDLVRFLYYHHEWTFREPLY